MKLSHFEMRFFIVYMSFYRFTTRFCVCCSRKLGNLFDFDNIGVDMKGFSGFQTRSGLVNHRYQTN